MDAQDVVFLVLGAAIGYYVARHFMVSGGQVA